LKSALAATVSVLLGLPGTPSSAVAGVTEFPTWVASVSFGTGDRLEGSGRIVEEVRSLSNFTAVHITGPVNVELKAADRDSVLVRTDDNLVPLIETRVTDGDRPVLEIGVRPGAAFRAARAPVIVVQFRTLSELVARGSGNVRADRLEADDFALSLSGSGDARIETLLARRFAAVLSGSGDLVVRGGRADDQAYRLAGSGDLGAGRLAGRRVQVSIAGSGDASVNAAETLGVSLSGSGDVIYRGSPRITQRIGGTGSVRRAR
jgi:hypothetical protein